MKVIIDAEFNSLENPTKIWCIVCKEVASGVVHVFSQDNIGIFSRAFPDGSCFIGHHIIGYDIPNINRLVDGAEIDWRGCIDTLVVSRLVNFSKVGGHSVENWGKQWPHLEQKVKVDDWNNPKLIDLYIERCKVDVEIQHRIYKELERFIYDPAWAKALRVEHDMAYICRDMRENGFSFDKAKAEEYLSLIKKEMRGVEEEIHRDIPPVLVQDGGVKLKVNKDGQPAKGTLRIVGHIRGITDGSEFYRFHYEPFNPGSAKQRVEYLNKAGWKPVDKTRGHLKCEREYRKAERNNRVSKELHDRLLRFKEYGWQVTEANLETLPPQAPRGAHLLAKWLTLEGRRGDLVEWLSAFNPATGRIHGGFNGIGSWTHRMSHVRPNQGNIFSTFTTDQCRGKVPTQVEEVKLKYNGVLRGLWKAERGAYLVGTDAEGIQMRVFAHYVANKEYARTIVEGNKDLGTDVHSVNRSLLGSVCRSRDDAKTFIYAWLLGAGVDKISQILSCTRDAAKAAVAKFMSSVPGIDNLKRVVIPSDAERGYFIGLDGRKVINYNQHIMLAGYLQNGEACVMKHANILWRKEVEKEGVRYRQVDFVHDEWQTEAYNLEEAKRIGVLQCGAIKRAGEELGMTVALAGESKIGRNWYETH